jgi:hypothetical protein
MKRSSHTPNVETPEPYTRTHAHTDIGFANSYRLEYIKHLIAVSTGVFVFSVTFMKDLLGGLVPDGAGKVMLITGWGFLTVSILAGVAHMRYWARYYISWGLHPNDKKGEVGRRQIDLRRRTVEIIQVSCFALGIIMLFVFSSWNLVTGRYAKSTPVTQSQPPAPH